MMTVSCGTRCRKGCGEGGPRKDCWRVAAVVSGRASGRGRCTSCGRWVPLWREGCWAALLDSPVQSRQRGRSQPLAGKLGREGRTQAVRQGRGQGGEGRGQGGGRREAAGLSASLGGGPRRVWWKVVTETGDWNTVPVCRLREPESPVKFKAAGACVSKSPGVAQAGEGECGESVT